ncbi:histidine phosphatase family protein [Aquamicrobium defluvii]|uniref:Phosphatase n=1 Tax=Aquamicrobium defluvii TaxID=69279 RepID=A0A011TI23_9HYPH|nr:histidine phosphatase family protein [Aquamicrobium defluvii]EXL03637.1 phosphatase [Aquamicrobium defluvii]EZQ15252.1 phosphatase [Halopseudomonas bauzanensis]TDR32083.1 putative phosphoglycerate mutase [Aquamicrobium defluvii]
MDRLLIVRHGESEWNAVRRLQGHADINLSPRGREQALALRATVQALAPDFVATSDLQRARDTAGLLGFEGAEPLARLREHDVGHWTGRAIPDLQAECGDDYANWRAGALTPPGGESWAEFRNRAKCAVSDLAGKVSGTLLVVAHGGVVRALLEGFLDIAPHRIIPVGTASLTVLRCRGGSLTNMRLELFNYNPAGPVFDAPD